MGQEARYFGVGVLGAGHRRCVLRVPCHGGWALAWALWAGERTGDQAVGRVAWESSYLPRIEWRCMSQELGFSTRELPTLAH